jgi:hypothetical protein
VDEVAEHPNGAMLTLPRPKTNQTGEQTELVVLLGPATRPAVRSPPCRPG